MEIESLLAIFVHYCIGHAWFAHLGHTPRHVSHQITEWWRGMAEDETFNLSGQAKVAILLAWAFVGPVFWPVSVIDTARRRYIGGA